MAKPKKVPFKPDRFQEKGRKAIAWVREREVLTIAVVVVAVLAFVLAVVFVTTLSADEDNALNALYRFRGDLERLDQALAEYGSTAARPLTLLEIVTLNLQEPLDAEGRLQEEAEADKEKRLARAAEALRMLVRENPRHELHFYGLMLLGAVLEEQGRQADAMDVLKEALEKAPASLEGKIRYDIGRLHILAGDEAAARPYLLEARARTSRKIHVPSQYGAGSTEQRPAWFENAEYLLARIGTGEKKVEFPEPETSKKPEVKKKPELVEKPGPKGGPSAEKKAEPPTSGEVNEDASAGHTPATVEKPIEEPAPAEEAHETTEKHVGAGEATEASAGPEPATGEGSR